MSADFVAKLRGLDAKNSQNELSIEKFLTKSERAFFDKVKVDKCLSAVGLRSQCNSFYHMNQLRTGFHLSRPDCKCHFPPIILLYSHFLCQHHCMMRWECLVDVQEIMEVLYLSFLQGCRCSCEGSSLTGRCMALSWHPALVWS